MSGLVHFILANASPLSILVAAKSDAEFALLKLCLVSIYMSYWCKANSSFLKQTSPIVS